MDYCREASRRGYLVTCGHSNATWGEMQRCFDEGLRHVDHFWCAMSSVASLRQRFSILEHPMQAGMEQFVLMKPEMSTEVLADGCHLAPELLMFALKMKGTRRLCLVTDSNRALGMPPGEYIIGSLDSGEPFVSNGRVGYQADSASLASTVVGLDTMVRNMTEMTDARLDEAVRMASLTPAERVGMAERDRKPRGRQAGGPRGPGSGACREAGLHRRRRIRAAGCSPRALSRLTLVARINQISSAASARACGCVCGAPSVRSRAAAPPPRRSSRSGPGPAVSARARPSRVRPATPWPRAGRGST